MIDRTTAGHEAEPEEVEAVLHNLCGYHLAEPDPLFRYNVLTREQVLYDALVAAIKRERGRALAEITASGHTLTHVAQMTNLGSRQRVARLIAIARAAEEAAAEVQAASLAFEEQVAVRESTYAVAGIDLAGAPREAPRHAQVDDALTPEDLMGTGSVMPDGTIGDTVTADDGLADDGGRGDGGTGDGGTGEQGATRDSSSVLEPTILMPALAAVLNPTKELPAGEGPPTPEDDIAWWRRGQDTGAA